MSVKVGVKLLHKDAKAPIYATEGAAGCDFYAIEDVVIEPAKLVGLRYTKDGDLIECSPHSPEVVEWCMKRNSVKVRTGVSLELPKGVELEIRGRSGLWFKHDIEPFNGTIDSDYRGEILISLCNHGISAFTVKKGMRIAQGVIKRVEQVEFQVKDDISETARGEGGLGSTGL